MADLNALIAQGAQFQPLPDPFAQYGKMQQLQQGQQANQLNQMKMQEMQAANAERNALRQLDPSSADYENQLFKVNPTMGIAYRKEAATAAAQSATQKAQQAQALKTSLDNHRSFLIGVNDQPSYDAWRTLTAQNIPELASILPAQFSAEVKDSLLKKADDVSKQLTTPPSYHSAAPGATVLKDGVPVYTAPPAVEKPKVTDLMANYQAAVGQGFTGSIFDYERKLKEAGRPPAAPRPEPAPSITTIVDPTDPTKMIAIDARVYKGGGVGSPGVIGVGGKEPGAALREGKAESGKTQLADDLDNLRSSFTRLNEMRAIPSTERNVVSNLMSAAGATGVGQALGKAGGSAEQVERDVINSARQRLITSIKNATGMSARSLDSNVELKTMLNSISDPGQSYEAAMRIIDDIENAYVKGKPKAPAKPSGGGAPPPPPGFKPDK